MMTPRQDPILSKLKWLIVSRLIWVTLLLGLPLVLQLNYLKNTWSIPTFYFIIGSTYFLSIIYSAFLTRVRSLSFFTSLQLLIDLFFETALITVTGGVESPFPFLYIITIISASLFFYRRGGVLAAAAAAFFFGTLINLQSARLAPFQGTSIVLGNKELVYMLFLYTIVFFTIGLVSGRLSEKLREKEIGYSELRVFHEDIVQSISSGLVTTDLVGRITSFNRSASEITGFHTDEAIGTVWWELLGWGELQNRYRDLALAGVPQRFEGEIRTRRGERCLLGITISQLRNERGEQTGIIGTFQDLTQLRDLEDEIRKKDRLAMIGEMAAGMAHEIRNPLASLSGSIEVLKSELRLTDENRKLMEIAVREAERLNAIITQFLLYAKPAPPRRKRTNLSALLSETVQLLQHHGEYHERIELILNADRNPLMIFIDPDQMRQVFWNLSINAFQAMPEGGRLTISTRRVAPKRNRPSFFHAPGVEVIFQDTGAGIRKEDLPKIFYPFFTTKSSGSGLGLSIVQRVIEEHFGTIEVKSDKGGTTFILTLPVDERGEKREAGSMDRDADFPPGAKRALPPVFSRARLSFGPYQPFCRKAI